MSEHVDRWVLAEIGTCHFCGERVRVFREPFSGEDACRPCWEQIVYGEDD